MKAYVKPELYFESFVLSQTVASCHVKLSNAASLDDCTVIACTDPNETNGFEGTFASSACGTILPEGSYCYGNAYGWNIFQS